MLRPISQSLVVTTLMVNHALYAQDLNTVITVNTDHDQVKKLNLIQVVASADASATGLMPEFAGGQVATGGRVGLFGNQKNLDTPFNLSSYTHQYIQDRQAKSVGDVLKADASVRVGRGFGNFQENYYIRGFNLGSDDTAYNGLYGILPRQYIATELFERVEVLKGASSFLNGAMPSNGGIGGAINLLPKRAGNDPLHRMTFGTDFNGAYLQNDVSKRFGENQQLGLRLNTAYHGGHTSVDNEKNALGLVALGLDYRTDNLRLSGDMGYNNNRLDATRPNVTLGAAVNSIPTAIDSTSNYAQKWSYSNEEDIFGSYRAEYDLSDRTTAYAAYGFKHGKERNSLANLTLVNSVTGQSTTYRFDNARVDNTNTGEIGLRSQLFTGAIEHQLVLSASAYQLKSRNAYIMDSANILSTNIYTPVQYAQPLALTPLYSGNDLNAPRLTNQVDLTSIAVGDHIQAIDEKLNIMLGGRYQTIKQDNYAYNTSSKTSYDKSKFTPALGLSYKITPEISAYANYIEALSKGLSNTSNGVTTTLKPFVAKQKEIGVKYETDAVGITLALFDINKQRGIKTDGVFSADGEYLHRGVELNTYGKITDDLTILGGLSWMNAKQKNTGSSLYNDKYEVGVPKFQANIGTDWRLPVAQQISLNTQLTYTGATYASLNNTLKVDDWTTLDIGAIYKTNIAQIPTKFNFSIKNVFDKAYWSSVGLYDNINSTNNTNNGYLVAGLPRTFMLSASFDF